jgi:hypothetical protein
VLPYPAESGVREEDAILLLLSVCFCTTTIRKKGDRREEIESRRNIDRSREWMYRKSRERREERTK